MEYIKVSHPFPFVLHVALARYAVHGTHPEDKGRLWTEYGLVFDNVSAGEYGDIRAVVLSSALPKVFSAGIDSPSLPPDSAREAFALRTHILKFQHAISAPERCPVPVIVAVHGSSGNATFAIKEVDVGLAADVGHSRVCQRSPGNQSLARSPAVEAEKLGLVSRVVEGPPGRDREAVVDAALDLAKDIASKSPVAVRGTKQLLLHSRDHKYVPASVPSVPFPENLEYTATWNSAMLQTSDIAQAIRAAQSKVSRGV
ncbi:Delta2-dienoyl-CoA-isomerase [Melanogaster broomeanus]|nr:Delta2-dienoyl-CoA-isomerase [Melanogaster broomeanus]